MEGDGVCFCMYLGSVALDDRKLDVWLVEQGTYIHVVVIIN